MQTYETFGRFCQVCNNLNIFFENRLKFVYPDFSLLIKIASETYKSDLDHRYTAQIYSENLKSMKLVAQNEISDSYSFLS